MRVGFLGNDRERASGVGAERSDERAAGVETNDERRGVGSARVGDVATRAEFKGGQSDEDESSRVRRRHGRITAWLLAAWLHMALGGSHMAC